MEKQQYILNLSLQQMALRKVAILLWQQADVLALLKPPFSYKDCTKRQWRETIEKLVLEKVANLLLPESLKDELLHVIKPIGPEILTWRVFHETFIVYSDFALDHLRWTSVGTVDYQKTADVLIRQELLTIIGCFKLACIYCLDEHIRAIWAKLSEDNKKLFYDERNIMQNSHPKLVLFWTYFIRGEVAKLEALFNRNDDERERTLYQYAFENAALSGNRAATEYFFQKLTFEEREFFLLETALHVNHKHRFNNRGTILNRRYDFPLQKLSDVLCYLLSQMAEEEQMQVFKNRPDGVLLCFMDWPWQSLVVKVIKLMWEFLPDDHYYRIMCTLAFDITLTAYNYLKIFEELFLHAPSRYRKYFIDRLQRERKSWLSELIYGSQPEIIKLVLRNIDIDDRQGLILCEEGLGLSCSLMDKGKWFLLELYVSECRLSSETKTILKSSFMRYINHFYTEGQRKWRRRRFERFLQLIDDGN